jgi:hypothetical protein
MYQSARAAFERVEKFCTRIAGASREQQTENETGREMQNVSASTQGPPTTAEPGATDMSPGSNKSDDVPAAVDGTKDGIEASVAVTETPTDDKSNDVAVGTDGSKDEDETEKNREGNVSPSAAQAQPDDGNLPRCGKCKDCLSFPFWYCVFCEGSSQIKAKLKCAYLMTC